MKQTSKRENVVLLNRKVVQEKRHKGVQPETIKLVEAEANNWGGNEEQALVLRFKISAALDEWRIAEALRLIDELGHYSLIQIGLANQMVKFFARMKDMIEEEFGLPDSPYGNQVIMICKALNEFGWGTVETHLMHLAALKAQGFEGDFEELLGNLTKIYPNHPQIKAYGTDTLKKGGHNEAA
ncbi:MAG: hypothetical protein KDD68_17990 [Bdellovibrionales bacterium]|nr:hypothetical protein [Bdellovibrionales bacterium]